MQPKLILYLLILLSGSLLGCSTSGRSGWAYAKSQPRPRDFDILEYAKENPLNITTNAPGTPGYGDPFYKEAVAQLSDISPPWTVPKIIDEFEHEHAEWIRLLKQNRPTPVERLLQLRCRSLIRVLAASRDSRAIVVLAETAESGNSPEQADMYIALFDYVVRDYNCGLPPERWVGTFSGDFLDLTIPAVQRWWVMNKTLLKTQARQNRLAE